MSTAGKKQRPTVAALRASDAPVLVMPALFHLLAGCSRL